MSEENNADQEKAKGKRLLSQSLKRFLHWLFSWRTIKHLLFVLACLLLLVVLAYLEENWRGKYVWEKYQREWEAKGERFDFQSIIPPAVPDEQNFALAPPLMSAQVMSLYRQSENTHPDTPFYPRSVAGWEKGQLYDLIEWQRYYRIETETNLPPDLAHQFPMAASAQTPAADVLFALSKYDSNIEVLRQVALERPFARFPVFYSEKNPYPTNQSHLSEVKGCALILKLRAISELQNEQSDKALADIQLMLRVADTLKNEPSIISHLIRASLIDHTIQVIWEGVLQHRFSDSQLAQIITTLSDINLAAEYNNSLRGERARGIIAVNYWRQWTIINLYDDGGASLGDILKYRLIPSGWIHQNQLSLARMYQAALENTNEVQQRIISPHIADQEFDIEAGVLQQFSPYAMFARDIFPGTGRFAQRLAFVQNAVNLARFACALERYHLAHNDYPESLAVLTPDYIPALPTDVINGQPMHYRRSAADKFVLYSIGWNGVDDGGDSDLNVMEDGYRSWDVEKGDWIWPTPIP